MTLQILGFVWLGAFIGAFAVGTAGFAFALAATALWLHVLDPLRATILVSACSILLQGGVTWRMRRTIEPARLSPFVLAGLLGAPIGVYALTRIDPAAVKDVLGAFLVAYGLYALATPRLPQIAAGGRAADAAVGFVAGILGGFGGYSGVLATIWTQLRGWSKEAARGVYQPFILVIQIATLLAAGFAALDKFSLELIVAALPALLLGGWLGWIAFDRLDERRFRQVLAAIIMASGAMLMLGGRS